MDATTTQVMHSLAKQLSNDFPAFHFVASSTTMWEPQTTTIHYTPLGTPSELLHELGHAVLKHNDYKRDIVLLGYERDAWEEALRFAPRYHVTIADEIIQDHLDTYRSWLHARSTCPTCQQNGVQTGRAHYHCIACQTEWTVNEARTCSLRRHIHK